MTASPTQALIQHLRALRGLTVTELRDRYAEVVGRPTRSRNGLHLRQQIVNRLRIDAALTPVDERERRSLRWAIREVLKPPTPTRDRTFQHDHRIPPVGTVLRRRHGGDVIAVKVTRTGFSWLGRPYRSLSAIARAATGARWNGLLWFGLRPRQRGARRTRGAS